MHCTMCSTCFIIFIIAYINVLLVYGYDKTHDCIHDKIDHTISQQYVAYKNHPFDTKNINKRKLLQSAQYESIRIRPYYDPLLINSNTLSMDKISYIKSLVSASILYLEQFVKVIPVQYPLLINRCQRLWNYDSFIYNVCPLSDYQTQLKCQYATIPDSHIAESWYYDPNTLQSFKYNEAGTGVADADVVIYVSYNSGQCALTGKTLAWASICNLDQYGRPISGTINFCPGALDTTYWKFDVGVTLHEIMHILVMSNSLFPYFFNLQTNKFYGEHNVLSYAPGTDNTYITTKTVKQISENHFHCATLIGAPLENNGAVGTIGSHWEGKYLQSELMCGTMYSAVQYLSYFTLALMQDSGWYAVDYEYADYFTWGMGESCQFFNADCMSTSTSSSNFEQYWCTASADGGCSYDYSTVSECVNQKTGVIPSQFKYYADAQFAGPESHDFCAFRIPETHSIYTDYEETCFDLRGNVYSAPQQKTLYPSAVFAINSRCVEIADDNNNKVKHGYCFKHECIGYDAYNHRYNGIRVTMSNGYEYISCLRSDALQWIQSVQYGVFIKCPNVDAVCGKSSKPFGCYWGEWSDTLNKCVCSVGYIGSDCSIKDINRFAIEANAAMYAWFISSVELDTGICVTHSSKSVINGFYEFDGKYEGLSSYKYNAKYLYYLRYSSQWNIANDKGGVSIYAYCAQSLSIYQVINIENCELWVVWDDVNREWIYDLHIDIFHCTPTYSPTPYPTKPPANGPTSSPTAIQPTYQPSKKPTDAPTAIQLTYEPTIKPTDYPTVTPTMQPTDLPTDFPTQDPTANPSKTPTIKPTLFPTISPTSNPMMNPTNNPIKHPTMYPTSFPTINPTISPTISPTVNPSLSPIITPTYTPTLTPSITEIIILTEEYNQMNQLKPSKSPTLTPTYSPSIAPTAAPTQRPTHSPTYRPTHAPTYSPTEAPIRRPTRSPTKRPMITPTLSPTFATITTQTGSENTADTNTNYTNYSNNNYSNTAVNASSSYQTQSIIGMIFLVAIIVFLHSIFIFACISNRCICKKCECKNDLDIFNCKSCNTFCDFILKLFHHLSSMRGINDSDKDSDIEVESVQTDTEYTESNV